MTTGQLASLKRKHEQADQGMTLEQFIASATPPMFSDDSHGDVLCIMVQWSGVRLVIETDGHIRAFPR